MPTRGVRPAPSNSRLCRVLADAPRYSDRLRDGAPVLKTPRIPFGAANGVLYSDEHFPGSIRGSRPASAGFAENRLTLRAQKNSPPRGGPSIGDA